MQEALTSLEKQVWEKLQLVTDPEITSVSLIEMGMVEAVEIAESKVTVRMIPTYIGCPALNMMENDVVKSVSDIEGIDEVEVIFLKKPIWTSDRITAEGREKLKEYGIAPPPLESKQEGVWEIECPYCNSPKTVMNNIFGPTACRSIFYCNSCKNPFEAIKPV
ncbi:1,2-phenylacetyl-CoA epoxidase subunit PaaD [Ammoniphilus sp. CFH 90114]|uniref:1,2-phenylacetyl-CoA epoxidase subunit PaaD n=1 Tax=Ammoniphilus sp. CFH 90114 TaxID=2493665 RepID=UPI00100FA101|nr:1,2-phenylacetyl-CoA epoxidase subunit PaaD [Ammoniphilus sp. CFH 90114]RXT08784.1 phenylacetate-CoA oxygenase subunit PaaJ [Ammoniphilus sp. CFH 90114]